MTNTMTNTATTAASPTLATYKNQVSALSDTAMSGIETTRKGIDALQEGMMDLSDTCDDLIAAHEELMDLSKDALEHLRQMQKDSQDTIRGLQILSDCLEMIREHLVQEGKVIPPFLLEESGREKSLRSCHQKHSL